MNAVLNFDESWLPKNEIEEKRLRMVENLASYEANKGKIVKRAFALWPEDELEETFNRWLNSGLSRDEEQTLKSYRSVFEKKLSNGLAYAGLFVLICEDGSHCFYPVPAEALEAV